MAGCWTYPLLPVPTTMQTPHQEENNPDLPEDHVHLHPLVQPPELAVSGTGRQNWAWVKGNKPFLAAFKLSYVVKPYSLDRHILGNSRKQSVLVCSPEAQTILHFAFVSFWLYRYSAHLRNCRCHIRVTGLLWISVAEFNLLLLGITVQHNLLHQFLIWN